MDRFLTNKFLAAIDAVTLATVIFGGGVMWQKVDGLTRAVDDIQARSFQTTPAAAERLARIEAVLIQMDTRQREDSSEIKRRLERLEQSR